MILPIFSSQIHNFYPHLNFHNIHSLPGLCNSVSVVCQITCNTFHVILTDLNDFSVDFGVFFLSTSHSECSPHFVSMAMHITESLPISICFIEFYFFFYLIIIKKNAQCSVFGYSVPLIRNVQKNELLQLRCFNHYLLEDNFQN